MNNRIFFSPQTLCFYPQEFEKLYRKNNNWPGDLVEVPESVYREFALDEAPSGKIKSLGDDNLPCWITLEPNLESRVKLELDWIESEMLFIRDEIEKLQDSDSSSVGTVAGWRAYRKVLRAWDKASEFPDKSFRPVQPK